MADIFDEVAKDAPKTATATQAKPNGDIFDQVAKDSATKKAPTGDDKATTETLPQRFVRHVETGIKNIPNMLEETASAPAVGYEMFKKFTGQPNQLKEMPIRALKTFAMTPEGEAGEAAVGERTATKAIPVEEAPGMASRVGKVLTRRIPGVKLTEDLIDAIKGPAPEPPAIPVPKVPETNGIPWGSGGQGPLSLRGKMIPQEAPITTATSVPKAQVSKVLDTTLKEAVGAGEIKPGVSMRDQFKPAIPTEVPEGHTPVSSSALKSYKYDAAARELHVTPNSGNTIIYGDVTPEQAKAVRTAESKGRAWKAIRDNNPLVGKIVDGKRVPVKPATSLRSASPDDLTSILKESVEKAKKVKAVAAD